MSESQVFPRRPLPAVSVASTDPHRITTRTPPPVARELRQPKRPLPASGDAAPGVVIGKPATISVQPGKGAMPQAAPRPPRPQQRAPEEPPAAPAAVPSTLETSPHSTLEATPLETSPIDRDQAIAFASDLSPREAALCVLLLDEYLAQPGRSDDTLETARGAIVALAPLAASASEPAS